MKKFVILSVLVVLTTVNLFGTSIDECVSSMKKKSYTLESDRLLLNDYRYAHYRSIFSLAPDFTYSRRFIENTYDNNITTRGYQKSTQFYLSYRLNDSRFFNYFSTKNNIRQLELEKDHNYKNQIIELINCYSDVVELLSEKKHSMETLEYYKTQVLFLRTAVASGKWSELDLISAEIEEKNMELDLNRIENDLNSKLKELNRLTGLNLTPEEEFQFTEVEYSLQNAPIDPEKIYEIEQNNLDKKEAAINYYQSILDFVPDMSVSYTLLKAQSKENFISGDFEDEPDQDSYSVYFTIPFSDIPGKILSFQMQRNALKRTKLNRSQLLERQQNEYDDMINSINAIVKEIIIREDKVLLLEKKGKLAKLKFEKGLLDFLELKTALNNLTAAKKELMSVKHSYVKSLIKIQNMRNELILGQY